MVVNLLTRTTSQKFNGGFREIKVQQTIDVHRAFFRHQKRPNILAPHLPHIHHPLPFGSVNTSITAINRRQILTTNGGILLKAVYVRDQLVVYDFFHLNRIGISDTINAYNRVGAGRDQFINATVNILSSQERRRDVKHYYEIITDFFSPLHLRNGMPQNRHIGSIILRKWRVEKKIRYD